MFNHYRTDVETALRGVSEERVSEMVAVLKAVQKGRSSVYLVGNGGSASTASHFAGDLTKACGIRAYSLTDFTPTILAYGNDDGWHAMFRNILKPLLSPFDVVMGISCSGNSPNVVEALLFARHYQLPGLRSIGLIGADLSCGVALAKPDVLVSVPFRDIKVQEDCHLVICHAVVGMLRNAPAKAKSVL